MQYMVAVCLGRAFFISSYMLGAQSNHKSVNRSLIQKVVPNQDHVQALVTDTHDVYRAIEYLHMASSATRGLITLPQDVLTQKYKPVEQLVDVIVLKITEFEKHT